VTRNDDWLLTADERRNPMTEIDSHHSGVAPWTEGNQVAVLIDGLSYFARLAEAMSSLESRGEVRFTDWRGNPDERVLRSNAVLLAKSCRRGVDVRGLFWRSHSDRFRFNSQQNDASPSAVGGSRLRYCPNRH
jgi:phosphatidylserine/phosphatidylglycerophosphate/cardiolipin synthase-like enzyme